MFRSIFITSRVQLFLACSLALAAIGAPSVAFASRTAAPCPGGWSHGGGGGLHTPECIGGSAEIAGGQVVVDGKPGQIAAVITFAVPEICQSKQPVVIDIRIPKLEHYERRVVRGDAGVVVINSPPVYVANRYAIEADLSANACRAAIAGEFEALSVNK